MTCKLLCETSSHKARNDFIRTIHHTMHDNVYHMPPPAPASAAAAVTSQVMSAVSRQQQQQQQPRHDRQPTASSSAPATSGLLLLATGRNIGGFLTEYMLWECSVRFREIAEIASVNFARTN